jgi:integrase
LPFKHPSSGYYYCELTIPGYGKMKRFSLGTTRKRDARRMEEAIRQVGREALTRPRLAGLLDAVQPEKRGMPGEISAADLLRASNERGGYERLLRGLNDPPIGEALDQYLEEEDPTRADEYGARVLREYLEGETYSYLLDAERLQALLEEIEEGEEKKRASVCRYEKTLISKLIRSRSGESMRRDVFGEVDYTRGDDTRRVRFSVVSDDALRRLARELRAGYYKEGDQLAPVYMRVALTTGCAVGPLSRSLNEQLSEETHEGGERWGRLMLRGTKQVKTPKGHRDRPILILPALWQKLRPCWDPSAPKQEAFPLEYTRFYSIWKKAVARAGLERATVSGNGEKKRLRPHDLRSIFSRRAEEAGLSRTKISKAGLGHKRMAMTDRYLTNETRITPEDMRLLAPGDSSQVS